MSNETRQPVKYRVKEKSLIGNQVFEAGQVAEYDGLPADNLEPLCDEGRARAAEYVESNKQRVATMIAANQESAVGDPAKFAEQFAKALAEERAEHAAQMEKMLALQQESATKLAEAAHNMSLLAAALVQAQAAAPAASATEEAPAAPEAAAGDAKPTEKAASKAKG
ncbi:small subunit ribosomal protein S16 [Massilia sp. PDC64]|nr:hypothetical protein [Massilia sp. PDC64]SDC69030.1 small subunit ribosomal protein S16 [Massilia sp. PDC64]